MFFERIPAPVDPDELLEEEATAMLKERRLFRRGTGVRSPRSEREARRRQIQWREPHDDEIASLGACGVWEEMDAIAAAARLTADEKAVVSMECVEERSIRDMAGRLGVTTHRVRRLRRSARLKLRRCSEVPTSLRSLFHEEVEQKKASIYRAPVHTWRTRRTRGDER